MTTFTIAQLTSLLDSISESGLTAKQLRKKMVKGKKLLLKKKPNFEKIINIFSSSSMNSKLKRPKSNWQLFLSEYRVGLKKDGSIMNGADQTKGASLIWKKMSEDEKTPFNEQALRLSTEYKEQMILLREKEENISDSSDENIDSNGESPDCDSNGESPDCELSGDEGTKKKILKKKSTDIDEDFWGKVDEIEWTRYENNNNFWEFVTKDEQYITREGNDEKTKVSLRQMKSVKAILKSIANQIEKKENAGFIYASA